MRPIPRVRSIDSSLAFRRDPYRFITRQSRRLHSDLFRIRLLLQPTICLRGPDGARLFYDQTRFSRDHAAPRRLRRTLFGEGGVQGLDGEAHAHRKHMLLSLLSPDRVRMLVESVEAAWRDQISSLRADDSIVLYDVVRRVICRATCQWAGIPLDPPLIHERTRQITDLYDHAADVGLPHWRSRIARRRTDRWMERIVTDVRAGRLQPPAASAAQVISHHLDEHAQPLEPHVAAVELLNIVRPTVAVAVYITFVALAMHDHAIWRDRLRRADPDDVERFVQEVRRFYPFFPCVAAMTRREFEWCGYAFPAGTRTLLDLYATNHDPRAWHDPDKFDPDRFRTESPDEFTFIPQGGGDPRRHHRCAGELVAVELMKLSARILANLDYEVPAQNLRVDFARLPALPTSGFIMRRVSPSS